MSNSSRDRSANGILAGPTSPSAVSWQAHKVLIGIAHESCVSVSCDSHVARSLSRSCFIAREQEESR